MGVLEAPTLPSPASGKVSPSAATVPLRRRTLRIGLREEFRRIDAEKMRQDGLDEEALVRRAGAMFAATARRLLPWRTGVRLAVLCGPGNNGADGLAFAAEAARSGLRPTVFLSRRVVELKPLHRSLLASLGAAEVVEAAASTVDLTVFDAVVDGLLGTGAAGPARGAEAELIGAVNASGRPVLSLDIPSGLDADSAEVPGPAVCADWTVTVGLPKVCLSYAPARFLAGRVLVRDIGFGGLLETAVSHRAERYGEEDARHDMPPRRPLWHKNHYGHCVVLAGSEGRMGAAILASSAALRAGAGFVTLVSEAAVRQVLAAVRPEAMSFPVEAGAEAVAGFVSDKTVLLAGPGMGTDGSKADLLRTVLARFGGPVVLDADALTLAARDPSLLEPARRRLVLTPHPGEMARLLGLPELPDGEEGWRLVEEFGRRHDCVVVLKSADTLVFGGGRRSVNGSGHPGLAKAGSGDVLAGVVASVVGQAYEAFRRTGVGFDLSGAVRCAVWLHGAAAQAAAARRGQRGMVGMDVVEFLPEAWRWLEESL